MILFNLKAVPILVLAFAIAIGVSNLAGLSAEGPMTIVAGSLTVAADLAWRWKWGRRDWFASDAGGAVFWIPVWIFGIFWMLLGVFFIVQGKG